MSDIFDRAMAALRDHIKGRVTWAANPPMPGSVFDERKRHDHEWPRMDLRDLERDERKGRENG